MKKHPGYIALISVLILTAIGLVIVTGLLNRSISSSQVSQLEDYTLRAQAAAAACAEHALIKLKDSTAYAGNETFRLGLDDCRVLSVTGSGDANRTITTTSTVGGAARKIYVDIATVNPTMSIRSWQEVTF
ncbi:MAG: hypothetical protein WC641_05750 [Patescibacteria group bacterium]